MERVHCPRHDEATPSCVVYDDHAFCYGGCGLIPLSELGTNYAASRSAPSLPALDLKAELERIQALPRASVRGLRLPVDGDSFYILWPGGGYFKRRKFLPGAGPKYICPRGHKKPLFICHEPKGATCLAVVEGELNALSLATLKPAFAICSPGGVGDFKTFVEKHRNYCLQFDSFLLVLDKDQPGFDAATALKTSLLALSPYVRIILMAKDANEQLQAGELEKSCQGWLDQSGSATAIKRSR